MDLAERAEGWMKINCWNENRVECPYNDGPFSERRCRTCCNGGPDQVWWQNISHNIAVRPLSFCRNNNKNQMKRHCRGSERTRESNYRLLIGKSLANTSNIRRCVSWLSARASRSISLLGTRNCCKSWNNIDGLLLCSVLVLVILSTLSVHWKSKWLMRIHFSSFESSCPLKCFRLTSPKNAKHNYLWWNTANGGEHCLPIGPHKHNEHHMIE